MQLAICRMGHNYMVIFLCLFFVQFIYGTCYQGGKAEVQGDVCNKGIWGHYLGKMYYMQLINVQVTFVDKL